jgi:hypothetical protein
MRNINILGNLFAKDDRQLTDEERRLRASLGIKLPSQMMDTRPVAMPPEQTQVMPNNMSQQQPFSYGNKITMPEQFKLNTPPRMQTTTKADLLNGLAPKTTANNLITPQMQNQINKERTIALDRKKDGTQVTDFDGEKGVRTFTPNNLNGSILSQQNRTSKIPQEKTELDEINAELNNEYKSGKLKLGDYIQILAGAASDAFAIPGTGSNVMQGVLARQAASENAMRSDYDARRSNLIERKNTLLDRQNIQQENERTIVGDVTPELVDGVWVNQGRNKYGKPINLGPVSTSDLTQMKNTMKMNEIQLEGLRNTTEINSLGINPDSKKVIFSKNDEGILVGTTQFDTKYGGVHTREATEAEIRDQGRKDRMDELEIKQIIANLEKTDTETNRTKNLIKKAKSGLTRGKPKEMFTESGVGYNVVYDGKNYIDMQTGDPIKENLYSFNTYSKLSEMDEEEKEKANKKEIAEAAAKAYERDFYDLLSKDKLLSAYGFKSYSGILRGMPAASLQADIERLVSSDTIDVISGVTFGALSENELRFAKLAASPLSDYRLTPDEAFTKYLQLEALTAKGSKVKGNENNWITNDYRNRKLNKNTLLEKLNLSNETRNIQLLDASGKPAVNNQGDRIFVAATPVNLAEYYLKKNNSWPIDSPNESK